MTRDSVCRRLKNTWSFLLGEERPFDALDSIDESAYVGRSYFMPVNMVDPGTPCAVSVCINDDIALNAAKRMLGLPESEINDELIEDVCGEVCNVLSVSAFEDLSEPGNLSMGLVRQMRRDEFEQAHKKSQLQAAYRSTLESGVVYVLVYRPIVYA